MTAFVFNYATFQGYFPAFADAVKFPEATILGYWTSAGYIVDNDDNGSWALNGNARQWGLYLLTAHLTALSLIIAKNQVPGLMQTATIDKISVGLTPPPLTTQYQWWLSLTPYGQQLFALLQVSVAGGYYIGGLPETSAFRKVGGIF